MMTQELIDYIAPESKTHEKLLKKVKASLNLSKSAMDDFYTRWQIRERQFQAYVPEGSLKALKANQESSKLSVQKLPATIVVPYAFSTIRTIVTYLQAVFLGRRPIFTVTPYSGTNLESAEAMESLLQFNADYAKIIKPFTQWLYAGEIYGLGILKNSFVTETKETTTQIIDPLTGQPLKARSARVVYQGNTVENVDPFMFFPDPRVPLLDVAEQGEFIFSRSFVGKYTLKLEPEGTYAHLDAIKSLARDVGETSDLGLRAGGRSQDTMDYDSVEAPGEDYVQLDEGTIWLDPEELKIPMPLDIGTSKPVKFLITVANKSQIIRFEVYNPDHGEHPFVVNEPYAVGSGNFGNMGISDYLGPFQEAISWFLNSHIQNVKGAVNNSFIYDPTMIEEKDLLSDAPNKCIRIKPKAFGTELQQYFKQIAVSDVTAGHVGDMQNLMRIGDSCSAVNENLRGQQDSGGRKTATEVRTTAEAASSRLASHASFISGASVVKLGRQWAMNLQQYLSPEFTAIFQNDSNKQISLTVGDLAGDFYFKVSDGTLPMDKVALFDIWQQALQFVAGQPQLMQTYDLPKLFEFVAKLGGADSLEQFRIQAASPEVLAQGAAQGSLIPQQEINNAIQAF